MERMYLKELEHDLKNWLHLITTLSSAVVVGLLINFMFSIRLFFDEKTCSNVICSLITNSLCYLLTSILFLVVSAGLVYKYSRPAVLWLRYLATESFTERIEKINDIIYGFVFDIFRYLLVIVFVTLLVLKEIYVAGNITSYYPNGIASGLVGVLLYVTLVCILEYPTYVLWRLYLRHHSGRKDARKKQSAVMGDVMSL